MIRVITFINHKEGSIGNIKISRQEVRELGGISYGDMRKHTWSLQKYWMQITGANREEIE